LATAATGSTGTGGNVTINLGDLTILNGGVISTERFGFRTYREHLRQRRSRALDRRRVSKWDHGHISKI